MANSLMFKSLSTNREAITVSFRVNIGATGAVTSVAGTGVASVVRTSAGLYTITLNETYPSLLSANATLLAPVAVDLVPQFVSEAVASTKIIVLRTVAAAVLTDPANGASLLVNLVLRNTIY